MSVLAILALGLVLCPLALWTLTHTIQSSIQSVPVPLNQYLPDTTREKVLLVIAHPDDECMFFSPTVLSLVPNSDVFVLCLSNGNDQGMGKVREKELIASCSVLGISAHRVTILNHEKMQDAMHVEWDAQTVSTTVSQHISKHAIDAIITFDAYGVSGHANHISIYKALVASSNTSLHRQDTGLVITGTCGRRVPMYVLKSVSLLRKFSSTLDIATTLVGTAIGYTLAGTSDTFIPTRRVFLVGPWGYVAACTAMTKHKSQLVWFRYLYIVASRYMIINVLEQV